MQKRRAMLASFAIASVSLGVCPTAAKAMTPVYQTLYYSDSSYQVEIGYTIWDGCNVMKQPMFFYSGSTSSYQRNVLIGYCYGPCLVEGPHNCSGTDQPVSFETSRVRAMAEQRTEIRFQRSTPAVTARTPS